MCHRVLRVRPSVSESRGRCDLPSSDQVRDRDGLAGHPGSPGLHGASLAFVTGAQWSSRFPSAVRVLRRTERGHLGAAWQFEARCDSRRRLDALVGQRRQLTPKPRLSFAVLTALRRHAPSARSTVEPRQSTKLSKECKRLGTTSGACHASALPCRGESPRPGDVRRGDETRKPLATEGLDPSCSCRALSSPGVTPGLAVAPDGYAGCRAGRRGQFPSPPLLTAPYQYHGSLDASRISTECRCSSCPKGSDDRDRYLEPDEVTRLRKECAASESRILQSVVLFALNARKCGKGRSWALGPAGDPSARTPTSHQPSTGRRADPPRQGGHFGVHAARIS